ncbi:MAG: hypothetical protein FJ144_20200 [Deltaproteobacteria bacterium]|nr:hypothetical protein [Deltaproteobacteria bacterium]
MLILIMTATIATLGIAVQASAQWTFTNVTSAAQITHVHSGFVQVGDPEDRALCGGVAAGDYDDDGWVDLYALQGPSGPNHLYRNKGDGTFEDKAAFAGVDLVMRGCGATFADYDGDGWLDLLVLGFEGSSSHLFRNRGDGTFEDVSAALPLTRQSNSASFADYDRDGDLDAFVSHWKEGTPAIANEHVWRNDGGTFTDVGIAAGVIVDPAGLVDWTFTPNLADIDSDGWLDLLFASDFETTRVFRNDGDGTFSDVTDPAVITDENGMGAAICDYDRDGDLDWFVTSIYLIGFRTGNRLYRNRGNEPGGLFEDVTSAAGVRIGDWGWAATCQDFNDDGWLDLFHVNGWHVQPFPTDPAKLYVSNGNGTFSNQAPTRNIADAGRGLGVVAFDYDRDGDLDIYIANNNAAPKLYRNDGITHNSLTVKLAGLAPNTEGIGSRVVVTAGGATQMQELRAGSNYVSQDPAEAHFGLGNATQAQTVEVQWFRGGTTTLTNVTANQVLTITEPPSTCGNGIVDGGEQCDLGASNGGVSCCQVNCRLRPSGATCRGAADLCDAVETCDGATPTCPADVLLSAGSVCRASAGSCDAAERCDGASAACPADAFAPAETECRASVGVCDLTESCSGASAACPTDAKSTAECRAVAGDCDLAESCNGVSNDCPTDGFASGTLCRAAAGPCDVADLCNGSGASCPADAKSTAQCRAAAGVCDVAESCDGVGNLCPADAFAGAGVACRSAAGACDVVEACTGGSAVCPADGFAAAGVECRSAASVCDVAESCTGSAAACPADGFAAAGIECRAVAGICDVAESCTGGSAVCPANGFAASTTECRASAGPCDLSESCTGTAASCPADVLQDAGFTCREATAACDVAEVCNGAAVTCPADAYELSGVECRGAAGVCDVAETCSGSSATCPADAKSTAECRAASGPCDQSDACDGSGDACPADEVEPAGTECRPVDGFCDVAESCDGAEKTCPADGFASGTVCRAANGACDVDDLCDGSGPDCGADEIEPAGVVCRTPSDICDVPEECTGADAACPADTGLPDGDEDGACDVLDLCPETSDPLQLDGDQDGLGNECDPCTATQASTMSGTLVKLRKLSQPAGEHGLTVKGNVNLPSPLTPWLDPVEHGLRLVVTKVGEPRTPLIDVTLPPGFYAPATREGWLANPAATTFRFLSADGVNGVRSVTLKSRPSDEGRVGVVITGKDGSYPITGSDLPLALTIAINDSAGQCGEFAFEELSDPSCSINSKNDKVLCR